MSNETQAVANDGESVVNQTDETVGAQDVDELLSQYDEGHQQKVEPSDDNKAVIEWVKAQKQKEEKHAYEEGLENAVKTVKAELEGIPASDRIIRGLLHDLAVVNPKVNHAFENRFQDPTTWNRVLKAAAKEFAKEFEGPDPGLTKDRDAVASAVRSASTAKPAPTEDQASFEKKVKAMDRNQLDNLLREFGQ